MFNLFNSLLDKLFFKIRLSKIIGKVFKELFFIIRAINFNKLDNKLS